MGPGTTGYLVMEYFKRRAGLNIGSVPYQGAAPVMRALIADEVQFTVLNYAIAHAGLMPAAPSRLPSPAHSACRNCRTCLRSTSRALPI